MLAFKREAVALVVLAFYFLALDQQTQESRLQQLLLLQHLKRSRRKRLILLQIALRKTRRVRRAWSWPRNQFWFETLLNGNSIFNFSWPLTVTTVFVKILSVPGLLSSCSHESCMWTKKVPFQEPWGEARSGCM